MKIYLVCGIDHESYENVEFSFHRNLHLAKKQALQNIKDNVIASGNAELSEDEIMQNTRMDLYKEMDNNYKRINGTRCHSCDWENPVPKVGVLSFYSNRILEVEVNDGDFLCIWHHAYQGIDIGILNIGTEEDCITLAQKTSQEDCITLAQKTSQEDYENCEDAIDYEISEYKDRWCISFDDLVEWRVWSVIQFREANIIE